MTPVIIMAGGRGERLHALTQHTPKPMLQVGDKPMIESLIEGFRDQGFKRIWLCVHYKADLIEQYFGDGSKWGVKLKYTHERAPLGTGGALKLLPKFEVPCIVCNSDIITRVNYGHLMEFHARSNARVTMCLALHQYQVEFGVAEVEGDRITGFREKPIENFLINGGIYVLEPSVIDEAPNGHFDMPDLIGSLEHVAAYPIHDHWRDVGRWTDLAEANAEWNDDSRPSVGTRRIETNSSEKRPTLGG